MKLGSLAIFFWTFLFCGCASLIVHHTDSFPKKITKVFTRVILAPVTLGGSERHIEKAKIDDDYDRGIITHSEWRERTEDWEQRREKLIQTVRALSSATDYAVDRAQSRMGNLQMQNDAESAAWAQEQTTEAIREQTSTQFNQSNYQAIQQSIQNSYARADADNAGWESRQPRQ